MHEMGTFPSASCLLSEICEANLYPVEIAILRARVGPSMALFVCSDFIVGGEARSRWWAYICEGVCFPYDVEVQIHR
jgi:hypothetical protein